jgi:4-hydroxy-tetrahydrodipicolinate synthase
MGKLRTAGVSGWVPCGLSGEYNLMTDSEREQVLQFVKDNARPGETLIAGTNAPHTAGVIVNTLRAKAMGYDAVLLAVPFYTKPTQAEIIDHFNAVTQATDMDVVLYSYPGKDGVEIGRGTGRAGRQSAHHRHQGVVGRRAACHRDLQPLCGTNPIGLRVG